MTKLLSEDIILEFPPDLLEQYYDKVQALIDRCPEGIPDQLLSEFAEENRILPRGTPYPGPWNNKRTPYLVEPMDCLTPSSSTIETVMVKPSQFGATAGLIENWIAYIIKNVPGPTMYITATEKLLKKWVNKRLSPLLISCELEDHIFAQNVLKGSRTRTGNEQFSKEFPGGSLDMVTANSAPSLRMDSIRYMAMDEVSAYKWALGGEGDPVTIAEARTKAWKKRRKVLYISSPIDDMEDHIWPLYLEGDQRRYFLLCPFCNKFMLPDLGNDGKGWSTHLNLKWETKAGRLDEKSIHLPCPDCREAIFEKDKERMVCKGKWEPTAIPMVKHRQSYQASGVISLMDEWDRLVGDEIKSESNVSRRRAHVINNLGITYKEQGKRPDAKKIIENRGYYKSGEIPESVLFLTVAVDVQLGSLDRRKKNPARLELEVCGHGQGYRTWSILYKVVKGRVDNAFQGAWAELNKWAMDGGMEFRRKDGFLFSPRIIFIDSRVATDAVLDFCSQWANTFPIKGFRELKESDQGKGLTAYLDEKHYKDIDKVRPYKKDDYNYYLISTNHYKDTFYNRLKVPRQQGEIQAPQFCDFPRDYTVRYFEMLTAEEKLTDGSYYKPASRPNEALDCRIYNMAAHDVWLAARLKAVREKAKEAGMTEEHASYLRTRHVLEKLKKEVMKKTG